jgi:aromatic-L-amino-acid decarboxylase
VAIVTPEEFRRLGYQLIDWIAAYRENLSALPVMAQIEPGATRDQLPPAPPQRPEPLDGLVADLERIIVPGVSHWQHPATSPTSLAMLRWRMCWPTS